MPKRRGRKGGGAGADSCRIPFHYTLSTTFTAGLFNTSAAPSSFPRVLAEADAWAHFRIAKLSFRMLPTSPITVPQVFGYLGGVQDNAPSTFAQLSEVLSSCTKGVGQTTPTPWVHVTRGELSGPFPWYKTVAGTPDPTEEQPGWFYGIGTGTETLIVEFKGVYVFKTSVSTSNTPLALKAREAIREERRLALAVREKEILMRVLAATSPSKLPP